MNGVFMDADKIWIEFSSETRVSKDWLDANPDAAQDLLSRYKGSHPVCLCNKEQRLQLYIAQKNNFYLARMPGTGEKHASFCPFYGAPPALSGMAVYKKTAVTEQNDDSLLVKISDGIGLTSAGKKGGGGGGGGGGASDGEKKQRSKMSLLALLHLLWEKAEFNRWHPRMKGRRNYFTLYKYLSIAAEKIVVKKHPLIDYLYIPEPFRVDQKDSIERRTQDLLYRLLLDPQGRKKRMVVVGVVKRFARSEYGYGIHLAQAPGRLVFWMNKELSASFQNEFFEGAAPEDSISDDHHLVTIMTVERTKKGNYAVVNIAVMETTLDYLPYSNDQDRRLVAELIASSRLFSRQLRYDADTDDVFPDFLLLDVGYEPLPMFVFGFGDSNKRDAAVRERIRHHQEASEECWWWDWKWSEDPPGLPTVERT